MTAVAPGSTAYDGINEYYASEREYLFAIADALREEYRAIHAAGLIVQVDDPVIANMYDALTSQSPARYRQWAELRVEALNHALRDIPADRVRYHVCFGSWHVPHTCDAPLEEIIDLVLEVNAGAYLIEAANPRHEHEWRDVAESRAARGQDPDSRRHHASHGHRGAPARGRGPDRPLREDRRPRKRHCRNGLRIRSGRHAAARAPDRHVGEVRGPGRRRAARESRALGTQRRLTAPVAVTDRNRRACPQCVQAPADRRPWSAPRG